MKALEHFLAFCLNYLNGFTLNFGVAIIILTLLIRLVLLPLGIKQDRSMKQMRELQPELAKLKVAYGEDKQGLQKAQMDLYKEYQINPLAGCLPILLQLPIFFALYRVLVGGIIPSDATFLWWHLSTPDKTLLLPLINAVATFLQQKFTMSMPQDSAGSSQMKIMLYGMPIMIFFISKNFAVGLLLYWTTSTLCAFAQYFLVNSFFNRNFKPTLTSNKDNKKNSKGK